MTWLLNGVYLLLLLAISPWLVYQSLRTGKYRRGLWSRFWGLAPRRGGSRPCVLLHAVSVGEVNLLATLIRGLEEARPDLEIVISTTTATGYELARKKYAPRMVIRSPLDFSWAVNRTLSRLRPDAVILAELELWPNLIAIARRRGLPVAIVNGRLSANSFRGYRRIRPLMARVLRQIELIAVQSPTYAERFLALGAPPECVHTTGSLKFDGAITERSPAKRAEFAELAGIEADDVVFLAGSTQAPEEELAIAAYRELAAEFPALRLIVVPRHAERFDTVAALLESSGLPWQRRSQLNGAAQPAKQEAGKPRPILLVDTIGELSHWWGLAQIGYVGGSMGTRGGQNMIEPAACGVAVCFGPRTENFRDVVALLLEREAAKVVHEGEELRSFLRDCLANPALRDEYGKRAEELVAAQRGATLATCNLLLPLLPPAGKPTTQTRAA